VPLKDWPTSLCVLRNPVVLVVSKYVFSRCELSPTPRPQPGGPAVLILGCSSPEKLPSPRLASVLPLSAIRYSAPRPTALTGWQAYCLAFCIILATETPLVRGRQSAVIFASLN
jgi:hypothetical protein